MGILDDSVIFAAVIQQGGFSRAARHLGISNGLISRRITQLESRLGVSLIKRTTRELRLTPEGELFFQHAVRIQQELDSALSLIQSSANKPKGIIRVSAPPYFGRHYLTSIIMKFLDNFPDIKIDLVLSNHQLDPIKEQLDLVIRGAGFIADPRLQDSSMHMKLLLKERIGLYASASYLNMHKELISCADLSSHSLINYSLKNGFQENEKWLYLENKQPCEFIFEPALTANDIESCLNACISGFGIGRFTDLNARHAIQHKQILPVLKQYDWGTYHLFAVYPQQQTLPERTRLFLDFIFAHTRALQS
ncbi:LysR family transcriptional regulator [Legionella shakespearei]|uniref:LysR family transcriptional regulator n=1 Tax=Legionella shakespearei DSM 23087 TaxID=1122169 RepID=A0A0W0YLN0_9GAMM|nr:LysR family transcriptional regulator [Legionella shakespearei]KTD57620.1 LysR family transcriptional regulator [Legionella shakespearei DSM 23087]